MFHAWRTLRCFRLNQATIPTRDTVTAFSIGVIDAGVGGTFYKGVIHLSPPGSIVLLNPGDVHTGFSAGRVPLSYRMLYVGSDLMHRLVSDVGAKGVVHFTEPVIQNSPLASQIRRFHLMTLPCSFF